MEEMRRSEAKESEVNHRFVEHMQWWGSVIVSHHVHGQQWHINVYCSHSNSHFQANHYDWHQMLLTYELMLF